MLNSDIVTGISLMLMFIAFGISLIKTILLRTSFNVPYVMLSVMPKLKQTSGTPYEAAMDLGTGPVKAFSRLSSLISFRACYRAS